MTNNTIRELRTVAQAAALEYGVVRAFIAVHPAVCTLAALAIGWATGHYL
jgi:hypothetical protein